MAEDGFAPDEWDPPALSRHMPFPPPVLVDWDVKWTAPLFFFGIEAWQFYRGWHADPWFPWWYLWACGGLALCWMLNFVIRIQHRSLFGWLFVLGRYVSLWAVAPILMRPVPYRWARRMHRGGIKGWLTILLPRNVGRRLLANVNVMEDGLIDTSGLTGPRWWRWLFAVARGIEPLVALLWISDTGNLDLYDEESREGVWAARLELLARPAHRMSLYLRVRPFPVEDIVRAAGMLSAPSLSKKHGPVSESRGSGNAATWKGRSSRPNRVRSPELETAQELREWAGALVQRRLLLAVPAARRRVLEFRLMGLLGVSDEQPGTLGRAGLFGRRLTEDEVEELGSDAWGPLFQPALAIAPKHLEVETGANDPAPIGIAPEQPEGGNPGVRRHRTYVITGLPERVRVGYLEPLTARRLLIDLAIHMSPVHDAWAELVLGLKQAWWGSMSFGREKYALARLQARRTTNLVRQRRARVFDVGMYATVSETQTPAAELALDEMVGYENYFAPSFDQLAARVATEPTGRDPLGKHWWTDSQTIAASWPGTGGIWVPGSTLIGESARSNEPIGVNLWWEGDETSVWVVLGRSGSGKTNLVQAAVGRMIAPHPDHWLAKRPPPTVVAYSKRYDEWKAFCQFYGGQHYRLSEIPWREAIKAAPMDSRIVAFNLSGMPNDEQVLFMDALELWVMAHQKGRAKYPFLYIVGEAWAWCQDPAKAAKLKDLALTVRGEGIGLIIDTQFVHHLLNSAAADVLGAASIWTAMKLKTRERHILEEEFDIGPAGMKFLAQIAQPNTLAGGVQSIKGQGIIEAHGLRTTLRVKRFGYEKALLDETDPRRWGLQAMGAEGWESDYDSDEDLEPMQLHSPLEITNGKVHAGVGAE